MTGSNVLLGKRASGLVIMRYNNPNCGNWCDDQYPGDASAHLVMVNEGVDADQCTTCVLVCYDQYEDAWDSYGGRPPMNISAKQDVPGGDTILTPYGVTVGEIGDTELVAHYTP